MSNEKVVVDLSIKILLVTTGISVFLVLMTAYTKYVFAKDFLFFIETNCHPEAETCFVRDCDDYCPPNNLDIYQVYRVPGNQYKNCSSNGCENICHYDEKGICDEIICDSENGDDCTN